MTNCSSLFFRRSIVYQMILRWNLVPWIPHFEDFQNCKNFFQKYLDIVFSLITPALPVLYFISNPIYFQGQQDCPRWVGPAIYFRNDNVIYPEVFSPSYTKDHRSETPVPQRWLVSRKVINKVFWSRVYPFSFFYENTFYRKTFREKTFFDMTWQSPMRQPSGLP